MRTASTSRSSRGPGRGAGTAVAAGLLTLLTGCGSSADAPTPTAHPTGDTSITARVGERFTLTVQENGSTREHWYLVDPRPDSSVVRSRGRHSEPESGKTPMPGAGNGLTFTFEATGKGRTRIVLMHCTFATTCDGAPDAPAPETTAPYTPSAPQRVTYTVTVG